MFRVDRHDQRIIHEKLFTFLIAYAMTVPIFIGIPFVPFKVFAIFENWRH